MRQLGFIGLGAMGGRMTDNLLEAGFDVVVFDFDQDAVDRVVEQGATPAADSAAVARQADTLLLSLPGPEQVITVVEEVHDELGAGDVLVDLTTSTPSTTNSIAAELLADEVTVLGAPVSGGTSGAADGTLSVMVGGDREAFEACEDVFDAIGSDVFYIDDSPGDGHAMKLLNNYLSFVAMICSSEVVALGEQVGLDPETMLEVINVSSGRNTATSFKFPEYILPETYDMEYEMGLVEKDMQLLMDVADNEGAPFLTGGNLRQVIAHIRKEMGADADYTEIYRFFSAVMGDAEMPRPDDGAGE